MCFRIVLFKLGYAIIFMIYRFIKNYVGNWGLRYMRTLEVIESSEDKLFLKNSNLKNDKKRFYVSEIRII